MIRWFGVVLSVHLLCACASPPVVATGSTAQPPPVVVAPSASSVASSTLAAPLGAPERWSDFQPVAETMAMTPAPLTAHTLPRLTLVEVAKSPEPMGLFAVDGALLVSERDRIGRIVGNTVQWFATLPPPTPGIGAHRTKWIQGRWPDRLDVVFRTTNHSAALPAYQALTGHGKFHRPDQSAANAYFAGVATVGRSTLVLAETTLDDGHGIVTVRGPDLPHKQQYHGSADCTPAEHVRRKMLTHLPDLVPLLFGATRGGGVVAVGAICETRAPGAEVWNAAGVSQIVDLSDLHTGFVRPRTGTQMLVGRDDDLWIFTSGFNPVLRFRAGRFEALPMLATRIDQIFLSDAGVLHASDGNAIYRFGKNQWWPVAAFEDYTPFDYMAMERGAIWAQRDGSLYRLRLGAPKEMLLGCAHPWVYLGDYITWGPTLEIREPEMDAALLGFPSGNELPKNELPQYSNVRVGIRVPSRTVGAALVEHLKTNVPNFHPTLTCLVPIPSPVYHEVKDEPH